SETRNKRRRVLFIGGGVVATLAIGTAVAMAVGGSSLKFSASHFENSRRSDFTRRTKSSPRSR
ncbi:hypothetical protein AB0472_40360, partial [Streptomyces sp. NPDC086777]